ncbi:hypothetical protein IWQ61_006781 [Dispira simplex]|nr:hypothetical protein IWQ61_006781 [Dispira simplex]
MLFLLILGYAFSTLYYTLPLVALPLAFTLGEPSLGIHLSFGFFLNALLHSLLCLIWRRSAGLGLLETLGNGILVGLALGNPTTLYWLHWPSELWRYGLEWVTPVSLILESTATFVIIDALGRATRGLVAEDIGSNGDDDSYQRRFALLITASVGYLVPAVYLHRLFTGSASPLTVETAALVAMAFTSAFILGLVALVSRRGTVVESAAMLSYTSFGVYFALASTAASTIAYGHPSTSWLGMVKYRIMQVPVGVAKRALRAVFYPLMTALFPYTHVLAVVGKVYSLRFVASVLYRVVILVLGSYLVRRFLRTNGRPVTGTMDDSGQSSDEDTHFLDALANQGVNISADDTTSLLDGVLSGHRFKKMMRRLADFTRPLWLMVYTHSLIHHQAPDDAWWRWFSTFLCITLFGLQLAVSSDESDEMWS